jgi:hypothetical protein
MQIVRLIVAIGSAALAVAEAVREIRNSLMKGGSEQSE